mmetsp:Transcript_4859/g.9743  ORF Transcript_4859/g.9743 Transcript_4859/m.9743 type:complete len:203 (+) Transcript_4859:2-610(+)
MSPKMFFVDQVGGLPVLLNRISLIASFFATSTGVLWPMSLIVIHAPLSKSSAAMDSFPSFEAMWRGVQPNRFTAFTFAPLSSNVMAIASCPVKEARWRGVMLKRKVLEFTSAPLSIMLWTTSNNPPMAAFRRRALLTPRTTLESMLLSRFVARFLGSVGHLLLPIVSQFLRRPAARSRLARVENADGASLLPPQSRLLGLET